MWISKPVLMLFLIITCVVLLSSLWGKRNRKTGVYLGLLLLSGIMGYALVNGITYAQCATVLLLLFIVVAKGDKST